MGKKRVVSVFFCMLALCITVEAGATLMTSQWTQMFYVSGLQFDALALFMKEGDVSFSGTRKYSDASWVHEDSDAYIFASGDTLSNLNLGVSFTDRTPFMFHLFALEDESPLYGAIIRYVAGKWNVEGIETSAIVSVFEDNLMSLYGEPSMVGQMPVPEPATMLLFGSGLAGLASLRRKKA
jgi:PEP-CTERM motif